jgi:hypothetical protein
MEETDMDDRKSTKECIAIVRKLTDEQIDAICQLIRTAECQGDWNRRDADGGSIFEDSIAATLSFLADNFEDRFNG